MKFLLMIWAYTEQPQTMLAYGAKSIKMTDGTQVSQQTITTRNL